MTTQYYRFLCREKGIYEAVELDCPRDDRRREDKPDGSWLPRVGKSYPGAVSFWTELGLKKYIESGLCEWHRRVVRHPVEVLVVSHSSNVIYSDEFQMICDMGQITGLNKLPLDVFLETRATNSL